MFGPNGTYKNAGVDDTLFIVSFLKNKLKIYSCKKYIGTVYHETSTWYKKNNEKFFYDKGALFTAINKNIRHLLILQFLLRHKEVLENITFKKALNLMLDGSKNYIKKLEKKRYKMKELITVIINVYNCEKYISKCIESAINQTYKNLEILIINDGSTDKTLEICKKYKDSRIKIITTKNQGLSLSRNTGLDNARGKYLYFIDADDYIDNDTIEYLYKLIIKYDADLATCNPLTIFNYNFKKIEEKEIIKNLDNIEMLKKVLLAENVAGATWNKLVKKELYDNIRFENRIINDLVVTYKVVLKAKKIIYSNQKNIIT